MVAQLHARLTALVDVVQGVLELALVDAQLRVEAALDVVAGAQAVVLDALVLAVVALDAAVDAQVAVQVVALDAAVDAQVAVLAVAVVAAVVVLPNALAHAPLIVLAIAVAHALDATVALVVLNHAIALVGRVTVDAFHTALDLAFLTVVGAETIAVDALGAEVHALVVLAVAIMDVLGVMGVGVHAQLHALDAQDVVIVAPHHALVVLAVLVVVAAEAHALVHAQDAQVALGAAQDALVDALVLV